jgi:hypothetical protein
VAHQQPEAPVAGGGVLDVERRLRRVCGYRALPQLRETLRKGRKQETKVAVA